MWMSYFFFENREKIENYLQSKEIQTRKFFYPLHLQPCYSNFPLVKKDGNYEISISLYNHGLCLPSSVLMTDDEQGIVINEVISQLKE